MKKSHVFAEIFDTREQLELKHLRTKNHFVLAFLFLLAIATFLYMTWTGKTLENRITVSLGFVFVLLLDIATLAYGEEDSRFHQLNKYFTTFGIYAATLLVLFVDRTPGMFPALFVAYAISAFYQDLKVMILSDVVLVFSIVAIMLRYPDIMHFPGGNLSDNLGLGFFVFAFVTLLTIASYIIIKQKRFFYNQIAIAKELEFRNIDLLIELKEKVQKDAPDQSSIFASVERFAKAFCQKLEIDDTVFQERLAILKDIAQKKPKAELLSRHPGLTEKELSGLDDLLIQGSKKLHKAAIKAATLSGVHVKRREIFSETQFKSLNHPSDSLEIKIIAFSVFYALLKKGNGYLHPLSEEEIRGVLVDTEWYYLVDSRIMKAYKENSRVFEDIVADAFEKECKV